MKKVCGVIAIIALNLAAVQAFAFSISSGEQVTADVGYPIELTSSTGVAYDAFCLEKSVSIYDGTYTVASVGDKVESQDDPISDFSKWVYAAHAEGDLPAVTAENGFTYLARRYSRYHSKGRITQEVIWYQEEETSPGRGVVDIYKNLKNNYYRTEKGHDWDYYEDMGWDVKVINFASTNDVGVQTLIAGEKVINPDPPSEVPEPATMVLFGLGLLGFAGVIQKRK